MAVHDMFRCQMDRDAINEIYNERGQNGINAIMKDLRDITSRNAGVPEDMVVTADYRNPMMSEEYSYPQLFRDGGKIKIIQRDVVEFFQKVDD